jgi:Spy/CpxP family protein refolding chaperone
MEGMNMKINASLGVVTAMLMLACGVRAFAQDKQIEIFTKDDGDDDNMIMLNGMADLTDFSDMSMDSPFEIGGGGAGMDLPGPMMLPDELNLSKDQMDKIKKIRHTVRKLNIPIKGDIELKRMDLRELMDTDTPDKEKIASKLKEIESLKTQLSINRINGIIDFKSLLTKDQREKLEKMRMGRHFMGERKMMMRRHMEKDMDHMDKDKGFMNKDKD